MTTPKQRLAVQEIPKGKVIDIGGGGEGVMAQVGGAAVVAVDKLVSEIHEARGKAPHAAWVVADGAELPFQSHSFDGATAFFSCMYMANDLKEKVLKEAWRVLRQGGEFWIWDVPMTARGDLFAIRLQVDCPDGRTVNTAYGVKAKDQSVAGIAQLLREAGFEPEYAANRKRWFSIKARKV